MNGMTGFKKAKFALALVFAAAVGAGIEWNGYNVFDREGGNNLLCRVDPFCRPMTNGEVALARSIFGDSIDYRSVKLFNRPYMLVTGKTHGLSPNGNIYINGDGKWSEDYAAGLRGQALLIHELTHVWQVQRGRDVRKEAFLEFVRNNFDYDGVYQFDINSPEKFRAHNLEQQAAMVTRYYNLRQEFHMTAQDYGEDSRTRCRELGKYEAKIMQEIPLVPDAGCAIYRPQAGKPAKSLNLSS